MGLASDNRLRQPSEFQHVLRRGHQDGGRAGDRLLLVSAVPTDRQQSRIGLSVSKRVGTAVVRNRVKRRLREIFREFIVTGAEGRPAWDIVATVRPEAANATYDDLRASAARLISRVTTERTSPGHGGSHDGQERFRK